MYRVTALNVTRIWIKLASRLMMGGRGNFSVSRLRYTFNAVTRYMGWADLYVGHCCLSRMVNLS